MSLYTKRHGNGKVVCRNKDTCPWRNIYNSVFSYKVTSNALQNLRKEGKCTWMALLHSVTEICAKDCLSYAVLVSCDCHNKWPQTWHPGKTATYVFLGWPDFQHHLHWIKIKVKVWPHSFRRFLRRSHYSLLPASGGCITQPLSSYHLFLFCVLNASLPFSYKDTCNGI